MKTGSYPSRLDNFFSRKAKNNSYVVKNFGVSGTTALSNGDHPYVATKQHKLAIDSDADVIVLQFGTNDAKIVNWNESVYFTDYISMIKKFQALKKSPEIFLSIPPPLYANTSIFGIQRDIVNDVLPNLIRRIGNEVGAHVIDVFEALGGASLSKPHLLITAGKPLKPPNDGCHPNDLGYKAIAHAVAVELLRYSKRLQKAFG